MAVAPFVLTKGDNIFFAPFEIKMKGVVLMIYSSHLYVTYDNDRRNSCVSYCNSNCNSNRRVCSQTQIKEKDNRPTPTVRLSF